MLIFYKRYAKTAFDIGIIALTIYLSMLVFSFMYGIAKPIFFGLIIYAMTKPFTNFLKRRGVKKTVAATISMLTFIALMLGTLIIIGIVGTAQIEQLSKTIPQYIGYLQYQVENNSGFFQDKIENIHPDILNKAKEYLGVFGTKISSSISTILMSMIAIMTSVSKVLINIGLGIILAYFLSLEIDIWKKQFEEKTPRTFKKAFSFFKEKVLKGLGDYIVAQLKLICITFAITLIGMLFLGVSSALILALLCAILDLVPLLGIGVIFVPWAVYSMVMGDMNYGLWLLGIMAVTLVVRQILEPKIAGNSLGVSAFTMLAFMVVSLSLFGVAGFIMSPILLVTIKALYTEGYIKTWIRMPEEEFDKK